MLFDAYLMVDWSGRNAPSRRAPSKDAIWVGERSRSRTGETYLRTREAATRHVRARLVEHVDAGARVLVGFDFPYGYPRGFAAAIGGAGGSWRAVWDALGAAVEDDAANRNNRFAVAAMLNARVAGPGPFWGCPASAEGPDLTRTLNGVFAFPVAGIGRLRATEAAMSGVQETWKLLGNGSVGSQALVGIPRVRSLRDAPAGAGGGRVGPLEPGSPRGPVRAAGPAVLHAEIWPGIIPVPATAPIRDRAQVRLMCDRMAAEDVAGTLGAWFAPALDPQAAADAVAEEGWILGCVPGGGP
ncbi:MAG TPA: hypothetical protein PKD59_05385 [Miltoncostaeaceae bacterium]|nr:hypothetical protein [Miltoncostaeaceae bacterium]